MNTEQRNRNMISETLSLISDRTEQMESEKASPQGGRGDEAIRYGADRNQNHLLCGGIKGIGFTLYDGSIYDGMEMS